MSRPRLIHAAFSSRPSPRAHASWAAALLALVVASLGCVGADDRRAPHDPIVVEAHERDAPRSGLAASADATPPSSEAPPEPEPLEPLVLAAVGDLMLGSTYPDPSGARLPPDDGAHLLEEAAPILAAADLAFGNLEAPLFDGRGEPHCTPGAIAEKNHGRVGGTDCWAFRTPRRYGAHLAAAGFDLLSLANNHIDDFGPEGRASTLAVLDELGIAWSGPTGSVARLRVRGVVVELLAFATNPGLEDLLDHAAAQARVAESAARADVVIVSFHGGAEGPKAQHVPTGPELFHGEARGSVRAFSHAVIDAGADLVLGHGPHVVRPVELYRGRLIAYSLGSFATHRGISIAGARGRTLILELRLDAEGACLDGRVIAFRQRRPDGPRRDDDAELVSALRTLGAADFGEAALVLSDDGRFVCRGASTDE